MQRHGVGEPADVAGDHRDRAELAHRAGVAQQHAVEQAPFDVGQRHPEEDLQAAGAQHARGLLLLGALLLHQRDQLARDEREGHEDGREHDARHGEDDLDVVLGEPGTEQPLGAEQQHVDQAGDHRRDRERQIDQRGQQALARELELRDRPGRGDAEDQVQGHGDRRDQQREPDRGERIRLGDAGEIGAEPLAQRLDEHREQRQQQEQAEERERRRDQDGADRGAIRRHHPDRIQAGRGEHQRVLRIRRLRARAQRCSRLIASSSRNEAASIAVPTTVAPA